MCAENEGIRSEMAGGGQRHAYAELALNSEKQPKTTKNRVALEWYAGRWSIETFFKTLKTGCRIEDIRLTPPPTGWPTASPWLASRPGGSSG